MSEVHNPGTLLQEIYDLGVHMCAALEANDVDGFCDLVAQRGVLLDQLNTYADSITVSAEWNQMSARLRKQHETLTASITRQETRLQEALRSINRYKDARRSYAGTEARGGILHHHVQG